MVKVTVDGSIISRLHNFASRLELCDETGKTLGFFVPAAEHDKLLYAWARTAFSDDEIEQSRSESDGQPLAEFIASLNDR